MAADNLRSKKTDSDTVSPLSVLAEELAFLRNTVQETAQRYAGRIESDIARLHTIVLDQAERKRLSSARIRDARDMTTLIRMLDVKPEKGRRRDLKKIETLIGEMQRIAEEWESR
jgi:hypothetical protein